MKNIFVVVLFLIGASSILFLRFSGRIQPSEMRSFGKAILWLSAFLLAFTPITIGLFKLVRHNLGYDPSPLFLLIFATAVACAAYIAYRIAHWVTAI